VCSKQGGAGIRPLIPYSSGPMAVKTKSLETIESQFQLRGTLLKQRSFWCNHLMMQMMRTSEDEDIQRIDNISDRVIWGLINRLSDKRL